MLTRSARGASFGHVKNSGCGQCTYPSDHTAGARAICIIIWRWVAIADYYSHRLTTPSSGFIIAIAQYKEYCLGSTTCLLWFISCAFSLSPL
ncbi:hypothetical protein M405DRAFT_31203 [Rhizopogon salebrosus TDB-379]|nr:hypothetical protein M405DRAFT_51402 [Rhizopogon salebrosus TDB-379]KAJ8580676.1 hypothetical protein M405DRAFT_31203 [Rhizopogon salebrosus TDB-379]